MAGGIGGALLDRINGRLQGHDLIDTSSCSIFKVPNPLREINEKAYEPQVISIGPYHHGNEHLKAMEVQKVKCLRIFLGLPGGSLERYVTALEEMEEEVRKFYSEPLDHIGGKELAEMMLLDGFFIIGLIIFHRTVKKLLTPFILRMVMRDLLLVENQLPFSVLFKLYSLSHSDASNAMDGITGEVIKFFNIMMPGPLIEAYTGSRRIKHILELLHDSSISSGKIEIVTVTDRPEKCSVQERRESRTRNWRFIHSATELNEAGIKIQKKKGKLCDIEFQNGVMSIPALKIEDDTECVFRNMIAYEQCYGDISLKCFVDYITFMDCLINTGKDVELLCRCRVLDNWLGDHEVVATMFNRLRESVSLSEENFIYSDIFNSVDEYCKRKWNLWKANLWHNYFNTPWALISFIAAVILLLCTLLQTLFSILSYRH